MQTLRTGITALACLMTAVIAGFFWTYTISVMPGLNDAPADHAIEAMQGINRTIRNANFALFFFGTLPVMLIAAALWLKDSALRDKTLAIAALALYAFGVLWLTFTINVPMNEALAPYQTGDAATDAATWADYTAPWVMWNTVRMFAAGLSAILLMVLVAARKA